MASQGSILRSRIRSVLRELSEGGSFVEPQITFGLELSASRLGIRLRSIRILRKLTQRDVAEGEYSVSYLSGIERGRIRPSLRAIEWLATRLNVPITDLLGDVDLESRYASLSAGPVGGNGEGGEVADSAATLRAQAAEERLLEARVLLLLQRDKSAAEQARAIL